MTKAVLKFMSLFFIISILCFLSENLAICKEPDLEHIVEKVKARQLRALEEIKDSICLAESVYKEIKKNGEIKKKVITEKLIYIKGTDKRYEECLSMTVNGRKLSKAKMEEEFENGNEDREIKLPLTPEGEGCYNFQLAGSGTCNGKDVWLIDFKAKEKKDEYVNGRGYVSKDTFDIMRVELVPAKLSRVVKGLEISVASVSVNGYWMPIKFLMDLEIKVGFLYHKHIIIEETYSDYKLNNQLADSIFKSK